MSNLLNQLQSGQLLTINSRKRNGLIIYKSFHAEFVGPGAAIGGILDRDCQKIIPVGDLSPVIPSNSAERQKAYLIRRQWIRLTNQITDNPVPSERVTMILQQFENYFTEDVIAQLPDEAFALLVGVLCDTVHRVRHATPLRRGF